MLTTTPIIAFVPTTNPKRAKKFFSQALGLKLLSEDPFALTYQTENALLRVATVPPFTPHPFTLLAFHVPDIAEKVRALKRRRITFQRYPNMNQDPLNIWTSPSGAKVAWFQDPDGNTLSLTQLPD